MNYDFGPSHPLKSIRLKRTVDLLMASARIPVLQGRPATRDELATVHSPEHIQITKQLSEGEQVDPHCIVQHGYSTTDTPPFPGMFEAACIYSGLSICAADAVLSGDIIGINISGGLHHAAKDQASGFCVFNDVALAAVRLTERFQKVLCIDIDLHHGDGTEAILTQSDQFCTFSIHESGETLFPGSGFSHDTGPHGNAFNLPVSAGTSGDVWLNALHAVPPKLVDKFGPEAIVLQMGSDAHTTDPLGHLQVSTQDWLDAVRLVKSFGLPIVALGGGGYDLHNVPRMWAAACLILLDEPIPDDIPPSIPAEWGLASWEDLDPVRNVGEEFARNSVDALLARL